MDNKQMNMNIISQGWMELESEPCVFELIAHELGVRGVEVHEIFSVKEPPQINGVLLGIIFLFSTDDEKEFAADVPEPKMVTDEKVVNNLFFASPQKVKNSCATHALLAILLNTADESIKLGMVLDEFKEFTKGMDPAAKEDLINNCAQMMNAHNNRASARTRKTHQMNLASAVVANAKENQAKKVKSTAGSKQKKLSSEKKNDLELNPDESLDTSDGEEVDAYHYCSFVPVDGRLYELDSVEAHPFDHGAFKGKNGWEPKCLDIIDHRMESTPTNTDYCILAVVASEFNCLETKKKTLEELQSTVVKSSEKKEAMQKKEKELQAEIEALEKKKLVAEQQLEIYRAEDQEKGWDYEPFIREYIRTLHDAGIVDENLDLIPDA